MEEAQTNIHSAEAAALGFYYQTFFALLSLMAQDTDNATVGIEQLDDVVLETDGRTLFYQLKHSFSKKPPSIGIKSRSFWKTIKVWIDLLPTVELSETTLHLVVVGSISADSLLNTLTSYDADRAQLVMAMTKEALQVRTERADAAKVGRKLPYADRFEGCESFLALTNTERLNLMRRTVIHQGSITIDEIEPKISESLRRFLPSEQRPMVAKRLVEWWDRQIVYSLCGKRERMISKLELQQQISIIIGDIDQAKLLPDFERVSLPKEYQPDGMLSRQIELVEGKQSDLAKAIREEWRARQQRSKWANENPALSVDIHEYDQVLMEEWSDRHSQIVEDCLQLEHEKKCSAGLELLRWTHTTAPNYIRPFTQGWTAPYYVRGSYQILAINRMVGWHPDYATLLKEIE